MEPAANLPPGADGDAPPPLGELVVESGRLRGTRCALAVPLTLLGRAEGCEVRLNVDGVRPLHCAILHGPGGFLLRDLGPDCATLVNGAPATTCPLRHGDAIEVGPFRFRIELPEADAGAGEEEELPDRAALAAQRDALRVQAAAVAAQQAALTEEEARLRQQRTALERQEGQLAAHLEDRRQRLLEMQEQTRKDRAALKDERAAAREEQDRLRQDLTRARDEAALAGQQATKERGRLVELRKRLKRRWRRHWHAQEAALLRREQELEAGRASLGADAEALQAERRKLTEAQLRFNGEAELGRRRLREEWQQLGLAQQQWEECLNREHAERDRRLREVEERAAAVAAAGQALEEEKRLWQETRARLQKEAEGLEARVRNQRQKLTEMGPGRAGPDAIPPALPAPAPPAEDRREWPAVLTRLADDLADQRLRLVEQWQGLLKVHEAWQQDRQAVLAELEAAGQQLQEREQRALAQEQALAAAADDLRRRHEALGQVRSHLEGWQARLRAGEAGWESERVGLLVEVQVREEAADLQVRRLERLRQSWGRRFRKEVEELAAARARCEEGRQQYAALWEECQKRRADLAQQERGLAAHALSLERYRQEVLARAPNSAAAERRLERLRRRSSARLAAAERELAAERKALLAEAARLEQRGAELRQTEEDLFARREEWAREQADWESRRAEAEDAEERRRLELERLRARHEQDQRHLAELRDEVERIARLLLDEEAEPVAPPATPQAA